MESAMTKTAVTKEELETQIEVYIFLLPEYARSLADEMKKTGAVRLDLFARCQATVAQIDRLMNRVRDL